MTDLIAKAAEESTESNMSGIPLSEPIQCQLCGAKLATSKLWGLDMDYKMECDICGKTRGNMSSEEFIHHCRKVVKTKRG